MSRESKLIIFVAVLASLLEIIDTSIVNVAIPTIMGNLGATLEDISMVITGYAIANAIVLPLSAWLGSRIGRRKYYLGCIGAFIVTSVACGLAPNLASLIIFRILQGLAGGALLPTSQTLIYEQFPKEKAGMAGAIFGMSVMIGPTLGPTLGGYLTDNFGWRSIFNINLPLGMLAIATGYLVIKDPPHASGNKQSAQRPIDSIGLAALTIGIGCLQYVLERGEPEDWFSSSFIIAGSIVAAIALPFFVWWELRVQDPIINLRLFKDRIVTAGVGLQSILGVFLYGVVFILPIFAGRTLHLDATQTGMLFIPGSLLTAFMMPFVGKALQKFDPRLLISVGFGACISFLLVLTGFSSLSSRDDLLAALFLRGLGMAFLFVPINSSILSQFQGMALGQVSGLLNLFRQIGGSIGIALVATMLSVRSHQNFLDLTAKVSALNPTAQVQMQQLKNGLKNKMASELGSAYGKDGSEAAVRVIAQRLSREVFMQTFNQLMFILIFIVSLGFIPLSMLKFRQKPTAAAAADAH